MEPGGPVVGTVEGFGVFLSQLVQVGGCHLDEEAADDHAATAVAGGAFMWGDGIDGTAAVEFAGDDGVISGAVVDIGDTRPDTLGDVGAAEDGPSLVENLDDVAVLDTPLFGFRRVYPDRFIQVAIRTLYLAGYDLVEPVKIIKLGMHSPPRVVGLTEQGVLLGPLKLPAFLMGFTIRYPVRYRRSFFVIGEVLG